MNFDDFFRSYNEGNRRFLREVIWDGIDIRSPIDFKHCEFVEGLHINRCKFGGIDLSGLKCEREVKITDVECSGQFLMREADLYRGTITKGNFQQNLDLSDSKVSQCLDISSPSVEGTLYVSGISCREMIITGKFKQGVDGMGLISTHRFEFGGISETITLFSNSKFSNGARFHTGPIRMLTLDRSHFDGDFEIKDARLSLASLKNVTFDSNATCTIENISLTNKESAKLPVMNISGVIFPEYHTHIKKLKNLPVGSISFRSCKLNRVVFDSNNLGSVSLITSSFIDAQFINNKWGVFDERDYVIAEEIWLNRDPSEFKNSSQKELRTIITSKTVADLYAQYKSALETTKSYHDSGELWRNELVNRAKYSDLATKLWIKANGIMIGHGQRPQRCICMAIVAIILYTIIGTAIGIDVSTNDEVVLHVSFCGDFSLYALSVSILHSLKSIFPFSYFRDYQHLTHWAILPAYEMLARILYSVLVIIWLGGALTGFRRQFKRF
ncbi:hypothetical protein JIN77_09205 [Verrucomicrobiaceae bacterium R5-34]|nr:hypothetical protein [Verrucomicrobiaceae bacterium R5-34]